MSEINKQEVGEASKWPKHKDHLNKSFLEELGHKMWVTAGVRFTANERLLRMQKLSNQSTTSLSAYVIILSLMQVYNLSIQNLIDQNIVAFSLTSISILLLVFSQKENTNNYQKKADTYHQCALEVSDLHEELRIFKTMSEKNAAEKERFVKLMSNRYNKVLSYYPNHEPIDYNMFRSQHIEYFDKDAKFIRKANWKYKTKTETLYYTFIYLPPVLIFTLTLILS